MREIQQFPTLRRVLSRALSLTLCCAVIGAAGVGCSSSPSKGSGGKGGGGAGSTLREIRARGTLKCGILSAAGFGVPDDAGHWKGFDVDFCRAIAVALFNDPNKVEFTAFTAQQRFSGLQSGQVDVFMSGTSRTISRAMRLRFHFGPTYLYDGQGFLVSKASHITKASMLNDATVCVQQGTTTELTLADFARKNGIKFRPVVIEDMHSAVAALESGRCDVMTQDGAGIATTRTMLRDSSKFLELPERASKEPVAPLVRFGDDQWLEVVSWVMWATMQAEEFGITQRNAQQFLTSTDPGIRRFLGLEAGITDGFGLDPKWPYNVVSKVGNYGEIFERNIGTASPLGMHRGLNKLWTDGGLLYSPPFR